MSDVKKLVEELSAMDNAFPDSVYERAINALSSQAEEVERLREALRSIRDYRQGGAYGYADRITALAREALGDA